MEKFDIGTPLEGILNYLLMELNFITTYIAEYHDAKILDIKVHSYRYIS